MISFLVNGVATAGVNDVTVALLVGTLGRDGRGIAVAVNEEVVPRSRWDLTIVLDGDRVEILTAAQGG